MENNDLFRSAGHRIKHLEERINSQMKFAERLCEFHKNHSEKWRTLIRKADGIVTEAAASGEVEKISDAVANAEEILNPVAKFAKKYTIYCIGHAHIDMNWMWPWQETVLTTVDTISTVVKLMKKFQDFHFSQSQASIYAILEKYHPELLNEVRKYVREGRWEITASHWVECDKNLSGDEALCRHLLYTRQYMNKLFGLKPEDVEIDWACDTFGHAATVPSYLVKGGVKYVYMHRPGEFGPTRPLAFWWNAPDGAKVLVRNDSGQGYNGKINSEIINPLCNFTVETGLPYVMYVYGVGDHGGGPTQQDIIRAIDMNRWPIFPNIVFSTSKDFFRRLEEDGGNLPVLDCELNFEMAGCYTTQTLIKKCNRLAENRLNDAESISALVFRITGLKYESNNFEKGWRDTLFSQFHDILPGSGVYDTKTYAHGLFQKTMASVLMEETKALRYFASKIDTAFVSVPGSFPEHISAIGAGAGFCGHQFVSHAEQGTGYGPRPFLIFNSQGWNRNEIVEATIWDSTSERSHAEFAKVPFIVVSPDGSELVPQVLSSGAYWGHNFARIAFPVEIPGVGYAVYIVVEKKTDSKIKTELRHLGRKPVCPYLIMERGIEGLENEFVRLELNMDTGGIERFVDKRTGDDIILSGNSSFLEYAVERPHPMSAWIIEHTGKTESPTVSSIERVIEGHYIASIKVALKIYESEFNLFYEMRAGDPKLYIKINGTWFQRGTPATGVPVLRFAVPFAMKNIKARYEIPFGAIDRNCIKGEEVPALQWAQVSGVSKKGNAGCVLLNDSKHGHSINGNVLRLTLIRSSYEPDTLPEIGNHEINLSLQPFSREIPISDAVKAGRNFNHPLIITGTDVHSGKIPPKSAIFLLKSEGVILSAVKKAENGEHLIFRFFNTSGEKEDITLTFNSRLVGAVSEAFETDILERPLENSTVKISGNSVGLMIPKKSIATLAVKFNQK
ncbi:MAG: hypothetical protein DDT30_01503 [Dehalococcoidia bacterium]|nr:hypothetical protein [Bacillota bacterium]